MWCYFDESWVEHRKRPGVKVGVVAGLLLNEELLLKLDQLLFGVRRKYYGEEHARDRLRELKGNALLSNAAFKAAQLEGFSKNLSVVREILGYLASKVDDGEYIRVFASVVLGPDPRLICPDPNVTTHPFKVLCLNISKAVREHDRDKRAVVIYDQRFQAQQNLAIALKAHNLGLRVANLHPVPYFGVSHATPALQIADILAYIIAKRWAQDHRFASFYEQVRGLQWVVGGEDQTAFGINAWEETQEGRYKKV